jgi:DNA-directed RNA polymerase subunit RPC12/RpoP
MFQPVDLGTFLAFVTGFVLLALFGLQAWYDRRDALLADHRRLNSAFSCARCGLVYVRPRRREEATCPQCGWKNVRLKF